MGTTKLHVFDEAANKCRVYTTITPEEDLMDADRFTTFYALTGRGPGMTCVNYDTATALHQNHIIWSINF